MHRVERDDMAGISSSSSSFCTAGISLGLFVNLNIASTSAVSVGKSAEYLSCLGIVEGVKTAPDALPSNAKIARASRALLPFRSAACSRKIFSTSPASAPAKI